MIQDKINGMRGIVRQDMSSVRNIRQWTWIEDIQSLLHTASNRNLMENVIANMH